MSKRTKSPRDRYFFSRRQMQETQVAEWILKSRIKRGEGTNYGLFKCGCGCGPFGVLLDNSGHAV